MRVMLIMVLGLGLPLSTPVGCAGVVERELVGVSLIGAPDVALLRLWELLGLNFLCKSALLGFTAGGTFRGTRESCLHRETGVRGSTGMVGDTGDSTACGLGR
jgi:hypothetical protein